VGERVNVAGDRGAIQHLRNTSPTLVTYNSIHYDFAYNHWLVHIESSRRSPPLELPLFIGGCPVHLYGTKGTTFYEPTTTFGMGPVSFAVVDPRHIVDDVSCEILKGEFPLSIGMRLHLYGRIEIFYTSLDLIYHGMDTTRHMPFNIINDIRFVMKVADVKFTAEDTEYGSDDLGLNTEKFATEQAQEAVIAGADYWWGDRQSKVKRAIIWRTRMDDHSTAGVWLGNPATSKRTLAMRQDYESRTIVKKSFLDPAKRWWRGPDEYTDKGGFIHPDDLCTATIAFRELGQEVSSQGSQVSTRLRTPSDFGNRFWVGPLPGS